MPTFDTSICQQRTAQSYLSETVLLSCIHYCLSFIDKVQILDTTLHLINCVAYFYVDSFPVIVLTSVIDTVQTGEFTIARLTTARNYWSVNSFHVMMLLTTVQCSSIQCKLLTTVHHSSVEC